MSQRSLHQSFGGDNKSFTVPPFRTRFLFIPALGIPIRANARCVAIANNNNNNNIYLTGLKGVQNSSPRDLPSAVS